MPFIISCSTVQETGKSYDAVRLKQDIVKKGLYDTITIDNKLRYRNASALKGTALRLETSLWRCRNTTKASETVLIFKDAYSGSHLERIPLEYVDLVGIKPGVETGINWFEHYNDPLNPPVLREIPNDTIIIADCGEGERKYRSSESDCGCESIDVELKCPWAWCRDKYYKWYYIEIKGGYAAYNDKQPAGLGIIGKTAIMADFTTGFRFGGRKQWGLGLTLSSGMPLYNSLETLDNLVYDDGGTPLSFYKPNVMLQSRYTFEETYCVRPFVYGMLGVAVDDLSLQLMKFKLSCDDCKRRLTTQGLLPKIDFPLSYGIGFGVDVPIACLFDFSFDFGFRSMAIGEKSPLPVFGVSLHVSKRTNIFVFRFGITI